MTLIPRSIRTRLAWAHALVLGALVGAFSVGTYHFVRARLCDELNTELQRSLDAVDLAAARGEAGLRDLHANAATSHFRAVTATGVEQRSASWSRDGIDLALQSQDWLTPGTWVSGSGQRFRVQVAQRGDRMVAVAADETSLLRALSALAWVLAIGTPIAVGFACAGGWWLSGRLLAPIDAMAVRARRIHGESLGERLPVENKDDELGRLAGVFNDTFARLEGTFDRLRRFTADASHELRTPLCTMRSVGEVALRRGKDSAGLRDAIGSMLEETDRLTQLVDNLLTLTRTDASSSALGTAPAVDVAELASRTVEMLRVLAEEKQQSLVVAPAPELLARCDPALIRQAMLNLIDNAIKYTPQGGSIRLRVLGGTGGTVEVEVQDTGPGIAHSVQTRIFERFFRAESASVRSGAGLGLAIAKQAVERHGGRIDVRSAPGQGSLFRIVLPRMVGTAVP
jgi:heavy metal sensor kinase